VPNSIACLAANEGCPTSPLVPKINITNADGVGSFSVTLISEVTQSGTAAPYTCSPTPNSGLLTVTVTTPSGLVTRRSIDVTNN
jgi:hypothetical protein